MRILKKCIKPIVFISVSSYIFASKTKQDIKPKPPTPTIAKTTLKIAIPKDVYKDYKNFINNKDPVQTKEFTGKYSRRDVVEVVLLQKALREGGFEGAIVIPKKPFSSYQRITKELEQGHLHITGTSVWKSDFQKKKDTLLHSDPIIRNGEFEAGIYHSKTNKKIKNIKKDIQKIKTLLFVSSTQWKVDWNTLKKLQLKTLNTSKWMNMVQLVNSNRADVLLAPFSSQHDLSINIPAKTSIKQPSSTYTLIPIPNIKIGLEGSRCFFISRKTPNAKKILQQLNKGLKKLRNSKSGDVIKKAYQQSGFFNNKTKHWKKINTILNHKE